MQRADLQVGAFYFSGRLHVDSRSINRSMFWRVLRRSVFANSGRLFVILLALGAGAAVTAALLNLQVDAKRRITTEFRSFGSNVIISPRGDGDSPKFLEESLFEKVRTGTLLAKSPRRNFCMGL